MPLPIVAILGQDPEAVLQDIVDELHSRIAPDDDFIAMIGKGPLESLLHRHEDRLWPKIEVLAWSDPLFRAALRSVWVYDSPRYEQRRRLLDELT